MIYSSVKSHDLCYAVSESPVKGFRYGGIIVSIGDIGIVEEEQAVNYLSNTHGGLVEIEGQWYVFYHAVAVERSVTGDLLRSRSRSIRTVRSTK